LLPKALDLDRPKRSRTAFAKWQLDALETTFCSHPYLVGEQRTLLARRLGLSETQVNYITHFFPFILFFKFVINFNLQLIFRSKFGIKIGELNREKKVIRPEVMNRRRVIELKI
jgi:hypothetical protein